MFVKLGGWWSSFKPKRVCRFFQRSRWRKIELLNSSLRLFSQDCDNTIQLIKKKKVCRPASELDDEPAENEFVSAKRESHDPIKRIFGNPNQVRASKLRPHHLAK